MSDTLLERLDIELGSEFDGLDVFAVGGVVRALFTDEERASDVDLMVQGVTEKQMLDRGFTKIDATSFPVFHDSEKREVALAREERSTGPGHDDFEMTTHPDVTVHNDLRRRDFTCNAMAVALTETHQARKGELVDPYGGREDIESEVLDPVWNQTFLEDPLRVIRLARFAARLDFTLTNDARNFATRGAPGIPNLSGERIGEEVLKALQQAQTPSTFFRVLVDVRALRHVLPELVRLAEMPAGPPEYHGEGSAFNHTMMVLDEMHELRPNDPRVLLAALAHDLGKGETPEESLPSHPRHHMMADKIIPDIRERLRLSSEFVGVMRSAMRYHMRMNDIEELNAGTLLETYEHLRDDYEVSNEGDEPAVCHLTVDECIDLAVADGRGRTPSTEFDANRARRIFDAVEAVVDDVDGGDIIERWPDAEGEKVGNLLHQERVKALKKRLSAREVHP